MPARSVTAPPRIWMRGFSAEPNSELSSRYRRDRGSLSASPTKGDLASIVFATTILILIGDAFRLDDVHHLEPFDDEVANVQARGRNRILRRLPRSQSH